MTENIITILLFEKGVIDVQLINRFLKVINEFEYKVVHVASFKEGFTKLKEMNFDIILIDLDLPDIAGLEALSEIQDNFPNMPIIVLVSSEDHLRNHTEAKPFKSATMLHSLLLNGN